jgi:hypothetical protein
MIVMIRTIVMYEKTVHIGIKKKPRFTVKPVHFSVCSKSKNKNCVPEGGERVIAAHGNTPLTPTVPIRIY